MALEQYGDEALMEAYRDGDSRAFEVLLHRHRAPVFSFLLRQVGNPALAEDLLQEAFLRVIRNASSYERRAKFTTWFYTIARNLCRDHGRRAKHRKHSSLDAPLNKDETGGTLGDVVPDRGPQVDRQVVSRRLKGRLEDAISQLGDEQREVFLLREGSGLSFKQIADIVGCPENTVKSRMRYALDNLRKALEEYRELATAVQ